MLYSLKKLEEEGKEIIYCCECGGPVPYYIGSGGGRSL